MTTSTCTWIGPDDQGCTHTAVAGRSYCEQHLWRVYQQGTAVKRKKDLRTVDSVRMWTTLMDEAVQELEDEGYDFRLARWEA